MCRSSSRYTPNIHPSRFSIGRKPSHVMSFMNFVLDSGCIYQPPIYGLRCNASTPVSSDTFLERLISKEDSQDSMSPPIVHFEAFQIFLEYTYFSERSYVPWSICRIFD